MRGPQFNISHMRGEATQNLTFFKNRDIIKERIYIKKYNENLIFTKIVI